jgi:hypothetical protein
VHTVVRSDDQLAILVQMRAGMTLDRSAHGGAPWLARPLRRGSVMVRTGSVHALLRAALIEAAPATGDVEAFALSADGILEADRAIAAVSPPASEGTDARPSTPVRARPSGR